MGEEPYLIFSSACIGVVMVRRGDTGKGEAVMANYLLGESFAVRANFISPWRRWRRWPATHVSILSTKHQENKT